MRLILILFLLTAIVSNKIVAELLLAQGFRISLFDEQGVDQSEKENKAGEEDETTTEYVVGQLAFLPIRTGEKSATHRCIAGCLPAAYLEVFNPPPE